jgi:hypothetical protein
MPQGLVHFNYERRGDNLLGSAEVETANGSKYRFETLLPLNHIRQEVKKFLAESPSIGNDEWIRANIGNVVNHAAESRARRRLETAIKTTFGGAIPPYHIAGTAGYARRIAQSAADRAEIGNIFKKAAKKVGKGVKAVGKGTVKVVKATGKGTAKAVTKTAKVAYKGGKAVVSNPLTHAALSFVPGGQQASAAISLLQSRNKSNPQQVQLPLTQTENLNVPSEYIPPGTSYQGQPGILPAPQGSSGAGIGIALGALGALALLLLRK